MNFIEMTLICDGCNDDCSGDACALKRRIKEAAPDEIKEGGES
jgi:hypothetical protein